MKHFFIILFILLITVTAFAQEATVQVIGVGTNREGAIQDALRSAVGQALGTKVISETEVKNFQLIKDVVQTRTAGYISSYEVIKETPLKETYEVTVNAIVSLSPLKVDVKSLAQWLGGLKWLVFYDFRKLSCPEDTLKFEYTYDRVNEYLARKEYRYIERSVFDRLKEEAAVLKDEPTNTVAQKMALWADAEFFIDISKVNLYEGEKALGIKVAKSTIDLKAYDNCTAEGMGTAVGNGEAQPDMIANEARRRAMDSGTEKACEKLLYLSQKYISEWCQNGAPFLLRFYGCGSYRTLKKLKNKLKDDPRFGGQMRIVLAEDYANFDVTFKGTADELADAVIDYADEIPELNGLDVKLFYGRQISFAMPGVSIPE